MSSDELWVRLRALRKHLKMSGEAFGAEFNVSKGAVGQWEAKEQEKRTRPEFETVLAIARKFDVSLDWLADGRGRVPWLDSQHPSGGADMGVSLAQDLSDPVPNIDIPTIEWESIQMSAAALPAQFKLRVKDDAMSSHAGGLEPGDFAVFDRHRPPRPGKNVLLVDRTGYVCIRLYREIRPGHWLAEPTNPAYQTMDSITDGLQVIAAQVGHLY